MNRFRWLLKPRTILISIALGVWIGTTFKDLVPYLKPVGTTYMKLLNMCVLPLLMVAVISSIGRLLSSGHAGAKLSRVVGTFASGLAIMAVLGSSLGLFLDVGKELSPSSKASIARLVSAKNTASWSGNPELAQTPAKKTGAFSTFIKQLVPPNILQAFSRGQNLAVLFFAVLLGISLGLLKSPSGTTALNAMEGMYEAFLKMINGVMYGLPIGLLCIFSSQIAELGVGIFASLGDLIFAIAFGSLAMVILATLVIWKRSGVSLHQTLRGIKQPAVVAMATMSSLATIPASIRALEERFGFRRQTINLLIPLGTCLNPLGNAFIKSLIVVFMAHLYEIPLGVESWFLVVLGSMFASVAMSGVPGVGSLLMMDIALRPLALPLEPAVLIILAILPLVEPMITLVNVMGNMAVTALFGKNQIEQRAADRAQTLRSGDHSVGLRRKRKRPRSQGTGKLSERA